MSPDRAMLGYARNECPIASARAGAALTQPTRIASAREDRLGGVADRLDVVAGVEEGDDAAGAALEPVEAPGERADQRALVEQELDVAAEVLGVQQPLLERPVVERKDVGDYPASGLLVHILEAAEELRRALAVLPGELRGEVGPHGADRGVHGVVAGAGVHAPPLDLLLQHPVQGVEVGTGVVAEVLHQVLLRPALVVAGPPPG